MCKTNFQFSNFSIRIAAILFPDNKEKDQPLEVTAFWIHVRMIIYYFNKKLACSTSPYSSKNFIE